MEGKMKKFRISAYILFIISLFIKYISSKYSYLVENYYSKKLDIYIVKFLSKINSTFDFSTITQNELDVVVNIINNRPRKCLEYKTPAEVFAAT